MAKKFVGFKPETLQKKVLPALGYNCLLYTSDAADE